MEINNFRRLDEEPHFPKWPTKKKSTNPLVQIVNLIIGIFIWVFLLMVFLVTAYIYWFTKNTNLILQTIGLKHHRLPWWLSLILVIICGPFTLIPILIGMLINISKK